MKFIAIIALFVISTSAHAKIRGSYLEPHQQEIVAQAIQERCGFAGTMTQVSHEDSVEYIDQGISDIYMTSVIKVKVAIDQYNTETYKVSVKSALISAYDHKNKEWGIFSIKSVNCTQK